MAVSAEIYRKNKARRKCIMTNVKKNIRAVVCALLSLLLILTMMSFPAGVSALGLSKTSYTLTKGYSTTLSVTGANGASVTWSSSDKTVASVSSSGKVVGKSVGNATIYADVNGTRLSCSIKVVGGKLSLSTKSVTLDEGSYKYVTVRAKGSHGLKAVSGDKGIVTTSWVKPWKGDDIRLKLTAKGAGSTSVKVYLTKYPDVYTTINVTVAGNDAVLLTSQSSVSTKLDTPASIVIYSDKNNSLTYTLSDSSVAKVTEGKWSDYYCTLTITGLKAGTTNLTIARKDNPSVKKVIPITISGSAYYMVSDVPLAQSTYTDTVYRWVDAKTNRYKYMLLPAGYDLAKANTAIAKDAGKYDYYTVFDETPVKQTNADTVQTITATVNGKSVTRYVLVPANYDKPAYNTAVASYTKNFEYYQIYNVSPENYKKRTNDVVRTWSSVVDYKNVYRYILLPYGYSEDYFNQIVASDSGTSLNGYYTVSIEKPAVKASTDQILSFNTIVNNTYQTYYVLVPANYDEAKYNDIVAKYTGYYDYWKIYTAKPTAISSQDSIQQWTKIVDSKSTTRYILLPPHYDTSLLAQIKNKDLATQTSTYYVVSSNEPTKIESTDTVISWYNSNSKSVKWMLLPANPDILKRNDAMSKDTGVYNYYAMYSSSPAKKTDNDKVITVMYNGKTVFMLVPQNYDMEKVNLGMQGVDVSV